MDARPISPIQSLLSSESFAKQFKILQDELIKVTRESQKPLLDAGIFKINRKVPGRVGYLQTIINEVNRSVQENKNKADLRPDSWLSALANFNSRVPANINNPMDVALHKLHDSDNAKQSINNAISFLSIEASHFVSNVSKSLEDYQKGFQVVTLKADDMVKLRIIESTDEMISGSITEFLPLLQKKLEDDFNFSKEDASSIKIGITVGQSTEKGGLAGSGSLRAKQVTVNMPNATADKLNACLGHPKFNPDDYITQEQEKTQEKSPRGMTMRRGSDSE